MSVRNFVSKNLVSIVCVPVIVAGHYVWYRLQKVDTLVTREDRERLPFSSVSVLVLLLKLNLKKQGYVAGKQISSVVCLQRSKGTKIHL